MDTSYSTQYSSQREIDSISNYSRFGIDNNHIPEYCPFKGWNHYFPDEIFVWNSTTHQQIQWSMEFFSRTMNMTKYNIPTSVDIGRYEVDYQLLVKDEIMNNVWPQFSDDLRNSPSNTLAILSLAMYQVLIDFYGRETNSCERDIDIARSRIPNNIVPYIFIRFINYKITTPLKNLCAAMLGKLVAVNGMVVRASSVNPICVAMEFKCRKCFGVMTHPQTDGMYQLPSHCYAGKDQFVICRGKKFEPLKSSPETKTIEWQSVRIQENGNDNLEIGRIPRSVDCECRQDLVDNCSPGEEVTVIGILKVVNSKANDQRMKESSMYTFYIETLSIQNYDRDSTRNNKLDVDDTLSISTGQLKLSPDDYETIRKIYKTPNLFPFLVASLCPSIYGHELVKAGLLLGIFGGNRLQRNSDNNPIRTRSDIHVLIVGDPGLGKSQMLHACSSVSPRGIFVCGNSTTNSGLTVTLTKDSKTNGNDYILEAGALVLADQGICCIDEFDKMNCQHEALLEAMEQQSISLAKAGLVCALPARTTILAAANPVAGHYNRSKTVHENIDLKPSLLSRFDLIFLMLDRPNIKLDMQLTEHIMSLHSGQKTFKCARLKKDEKVSNIQNSLEIYESSLKSRLLIYDKNVELLSTSILKTYIAYARQYVHPFLNEEAKHEIRQFYLQLRKHKYEKQSNPITPRQLESLIRLSQARARAELRIEVTSQDVSDVIELVKTCTDDLFKNEMNTSYSSQPKRGPGSFRNDGNRFVEFLKNRGKHSGYKTLFNLNELAVLAGECGIRLTGDITKFIEILNHQGYLLNKGNNMYKLVV